MLYGFVPWITPEIFFHLYNAAVRSMRKTERSKLNTLKTFKKHMPLNVNTRKMKPDHVS
jgi:hypothetical protein